MFSHFACVVETYKSNMSTQKGRDNTFSSGFSWVQFQQFFLEQLRLSVRLQIGYALCEPFKTGLEQNDKIFHLICKHYLCLLEMPDFVHCETYSMMSQYIYLFITLHVVPFPQLLLTKRQQQFDKTPDKALTKLKPGRVVTSSVIVVSGSPCQLYSFYAKLTYLHVYTICVVFKLKIGSYVILKLYFLAQIFNR